MPDATENPISENIFLKSKRGRPRTMDAATEKIIRGVFQAGPHVTTRTIQNSIHGGHALHTLTGGISEHGKIATPYDWLLRPDGHAAHYRKSICDQLGLVRNPTALRTFALQLCEEKPNAAHAISALRNWNERWQWSMASKIKEDPEAVNEETVLQVARWACGATA